MFKGLGSLANLGTMLKTAQQFGSRFNALRDQLKTKRAVGSGGGGLVEVEVTGLGQVIAVRIDPSLFEKHDREMIEDLTAAAANDALAKAKQLHAEALREATGGFELPGLDGVLADLVGEGPEEAGPSNDPENREG